MTAIIDTPLPKGYSVTEIYLRRWLLNYRLRVDGNYQDRAKMLDSTLYKLCKKARNGTPTKNRKYADQYKLAKSIHK